MKTLLMKRPRPELIDPNPPIKQRRDKPKYSDADIATILGGGSAQGRRNWLTGAYVKGEIDREQVDRFSPGRDL